MPITLTPAELETALGVGNAEAAALLAAASALVNAFTTAAPPKRIERIGHPRCWIPATGNRNRAFDGKALARCPYPIMRRAPLSGCPARWPYYRPTNSGERG